MKQRMRAFFLIPCFFVMLTGCQKQKEKVAMTVWVSADEKDMVAEAVQKFTEAHKGEADFHIVVEEESVDGVKQTVLTNVSAAADVYNFASDQFFDLYRGGALAEVTRDVEQVIEDNGGTDAAVIENVTVDGRLYAYPLTASNGYFLYYNSSYFTEEDVQSLDRMLEIAEQNGKYIAMDWTSGWYLYSFFAGAGKNAQLAEGKTSNQCDFNSVQGEFAGKDVAKAMLDIAASKGFLNVVSSDFLREVEKGNVIAGVNGMWNAKAMENLWKDNCNAAKLPTYTLNGQQVQMASFAGFKYFGVNPTCEHQEWAMALAQWLTSEKQQMERFLRIGECPSNVRAASSPEVQKSKPLSALLEQNQFASIQNVGDSYWKAMSRFGVYMASGNPDGKDLQQLLDEIVAEITK